MLLVNNPIIGITRLVKLLFLLKFEGGFDKLLPSPDQYFEFSPWKMGPFSHQIWDLTSFLERVGLISTKKANMLSQADCYERQGIPDDLNLYNDTMPNFPMELEETNNEINKIFFLTEKGNKIGKRLIDSLPDEKKYYLKKIKAAYSKMPLTQLLRHVYSEYPEYTSKSEIKTKVLP